MLEIKLGNYGAVRGPFSQRFGEVEELSWADLINAVLRTGRLKIDEQVFSIVADEGGVKFYIR